MPDLLQCFNTVTQLLRTTFFPLNDSHIVLIPKKETRTVPADFRPISLINGTQRIFSKILATQLQPHMDKLLCKTQTGFLKGRNIVQGFHYAQELIRAATRQKTQIAILKADIHKAFDSIDQSFLLKCLQASGFTQTWLDWIYNLILQGSSKVVLNSVVGRDIKLKRGVRLTLINSVLTAMPIYFMTTFLLPKLVMVAIDKIRRGFLWHGNKETQDQERIMCLANWRLVTRPKRLGGLGIRTIEDANKIITHQMDVVLDHRGQCMVERDDNNRKGTHQTLGDTKTLTILEGHSNTYAYLQFFSAI